MLVLVSYHFGIIVLHEGDENSMPIANIKIVKKCAFCKHWYDPTNSAISPRSPQINLWEYEENMKKKCLQKNYDMKASAFCGKYECKLNIYK